MIKICNTENMDYVLVAVDVEKVFLDSLDQNVLIEIYPSLDPPP